MPAQQHCREHFARADEMVQIGLRVARGSGAIAVRIQHGLILGKARVFEVDWAIPSEGLAVADRFEAKFLGWYFEEVLTTGETQSPSSWWLVEQVERPTILPSLSLSC